MLKSELDMNGYYAQALNVLERMDDLLDKQKEAIRNGDFNALFPLGKSLEQCRSEFEKMVDGLTMGESSDSDDNLVNKVKDGQKSALEGKLDDLKKRNEEIIVELDKAMTIVKSNMILVNKGFHITEYYKNMLIKYNNCRRLDRIG